MDKACQILADTGINTVHIAVLAASLVVVGIFVWWLLARRRSGLLQLSLVLGLLAGSLLIGSHLALAAPANCPPGANATPPAATPGGNSQPVRDPNALELVDDTYNKDNGFNYSSGSSSWTGYFDILANDNAPAGDPIDPTTVRLVASSAYTDMGSTYGVPAGTSFNINNPNDSLNPWGYVGMGCTYDVNSGDCPINGMLNVEVYNMPGGAPVGTTFSVQYTAKTMSGKDASNTATVRFTTDDPLPPSPTLIDDSYTTNDNRFLYHTGAIGDGGTDASGWTGTLAVIDNDQPLPDDPFDQSSLCIVDPTDSSNCTQPSNIDEAISQTVVPGQDGYQGDVRWWFSQDESANRHLTVFVGNKVPIGTALTIRYGASSEGGFSALPATVTVTQSSELPPTLIDDNYSPSDFSYNDDAGAGPVGYSATFDILQNDQPRTGDPLDPSTLCIVDPNDSSSCLQPSSIGSAVTQTIYTGEPGYQWDVRWWIVDGPGGSKQLSVFVGQGADPSAAHSIGYRVRSQSGALGRSATVTVQAESAQT